MITFVRLKKKESTKNNTTYNIKRLLLLRKNYN